MAQTILSLHPPITGGAQGVVPINEVCVAYTQLLKSWSDASASIPEDEIFTMEKMFSKGGILRVKVLSTTQDKKDEGTNTNIKKWHVGYGND